MRIITEPTVKVVSKPEFLEPENRPVPPDGNELTRLGAFAAKGCYGTHGEDGRACEKNQKAILEHKHGSVLEHINIGFWIEGITRALSLELNRHRHFAISQRSTRYTDEEEAAIVLEPYFAELYEKWGPIHESRQPLRAQNEQDSQEQLALRRHLNSAEENIEAYAQQVRALMRLNPERLEGRDLRKWARGKARNSLPHNLETKGTWTTNVRSWRWILEARGNRHAADEIRRLAFMIYYKLREVAPTYFEDFSVELNDGVEELVPGHSKA